MTDKQIIYNCPHISLTDWGTYACKLYNPRDKNCLVVSGNCDSNVGCPYKQLKRAEQECDQLKAELSQEKNQHNILKKMFADIDKANVGLHNKLDQLKANIKILHFTLDQRNGRIHTLYQTLQEIKEIAEKQMTICSCEFDLNNYESGCRECSSKDARVIAKHILQKISEVE